MTSDPPLAGLAASLGDSAATRPRVAVVGAGIAGLTAAYVLRRTHEVTLYEAQSRLGGHADTHDVADAAGGPLAVDTGFIVHNARTYPTLLRLFEEWGVATQETDMSLSVSCEGCGLEYSGGQGPGGVLAQPAALLRPRFVRMLAEITRFHREASAALAQDTHREGSHSELTLGEFLAAGRFSPYTVQHFVTPLIASVWSCGAATALQYPARYLFSFLDNHGMLSITGSPTWRTVTGGSRTYVERAVAGLAAVRTGTPVTAVARRPRDGDASDQGTDGRRHVRVTDASGGVERFDAVVVATHPDQALALLADATPAERETLGAFTYSLNPTVLHTDTSVLPRRARAQASWNYRMDACDTTADAVRVSYDMTRLQRLPRHGERYVVSLNLGADDVAPSRVIDRMVYAHPQYTPRSVAAQRALPALHDGVTAFAGAYHGWGFHEDGARSGLAAARSLGGDW